MPTREQTSLGLQHTFQATSQDHNPPCRGCKQLYKDHIDLDGKKICPWPKEYPRPTNG